MKILTMALCMQFFLANIVYAHNSNLNGNSNNNANFNALIPIYNSDSTTTVKNTNTTEFPVSTAVAPSNISTSDCLGSISAGGQGQFAGFSLGFSKQSKPCNIRAYASQFPRYSSMWWGVMCQDSMIRKADKSTGGRNCPKAEKKSKPKNSHGR